MQLPNHASSQSLRPCALCPPCPSIASVPPCMAMLHMRTAHLVLPLMQEGCVRQDALHAQVREAACKHALSSTSYQITAHQIMQKSHQTTAQHSTSDHSTAQHSRVQHRRTAQASQHRASPHASQHKPVPVPHSTSQHHTLRMLRTYYTT